VLGVGVGVEGNLIKLIVSADEGLQRINSTTTEKLCVGR
jgi:hypothetical protein